jgi:hypothetical protein
MWTFFSELPKSELTLAAVLHAAAATVTAASAVTSRRARLVALVLNFTDLSFAMVSRDQ